MKKRICAIVSLIFVICAACGCGTRTDRGSFSDTRYMLDTVCTVTAGGEDAERLVSEVFDLISRIEGEIDRFDESSAVSAFNSAPAGTETALTNACAEIISEALNMYGESGGAFDITVAPVEDLWDFKSDDPTVPDPASVSAALERVGGDKLIFDAENKTLAKTEDGVMIDLGGCGKGYCCQAALDYISENYPNNWAILDLGGNVGVFGKNPRSDDGSFTVGIQSPDGENGAYSMTEKVFSGASAVTSGTYQRHFVKDGVNYHHILDPKTGMPASNGHESATIICASGLAADCLSTACMVLPEAEGRALAEQYGAKVIYQ